MTQPKNNVLQVLKPKFRVEEVLKEIKECLDIGWSGMGFKTTEFEKEWSLKYQFKYSHFLNSATTGLHLAVKIMKDKYKWKEGDEIITSSLTFVSSNHAILYERLSPVFADIDSSLCLDPESVEKMITPRTRAIMYIGIGGNAKNYKKIREICSDRDITLILDAAHMAGTTWVSGNHHVGLDADITVFSYQAVKNCPGSDAGMICSNDPELDAAARNLSWLGINKTTYDRYSKSSYSWEYDVPNLGFKYHGNSISAAMCLVSLRYLEEDNSYRRKLASLYFDRLSQSTHSNSEIEIIEHDDSIISSRHLFQISVNNRDEVLQKLASQDVYCGVHYIANHTYDIYKDFKADTERAAYYSQRILSLPLHLGLIEADVDRVSDILIS
jgi:dTDP-4-amino-4,6-dideoxygalactose transaminase